MESVIDLGSFGLSLKGQRRCLEFLNNMELLVYIECTNVYSLLLNHWINISATILISKDHLPKGDKTFCCLMRNISVNVESKFQYFEFLGALFDLVWYFKYLIYEYFCLIFIYHFRSEVPSLIKRNEMKTSSFEYSYEYWVWNYILITIMNSMLYPFFNWYNIARVYK